MEPMLATDAATLVSPATTEQAVARERLYALPEDAIVELRAMPSLRRFAWLFANTDIEDRPFHDRFVTDVVEGGQDLQAWGRLWVLFPQGAIAELLSRDATTALAAVSADVQPNWIALKADERLWASGIEQCGAPGVLRSDLTYFWRSPPGVGRQWPYGVMIEPCPDPVVRYRRWIASRIAYLARHYKIKINDVPEKLGLSAADLAVDTRLALQGLASEPPLDDGVPGFRGSDAAYR
jgi:hypothetical protein